MPLPAITDFLYPLQWELKLINAEGAWLELQGLSASKTFGNADVVVAVLDSGIQSEEKLNGDIEAMHQCLFLIL